MVGIVTSRRPYVDGRYLNAQPDLAVHDPATEQELCRVASTTPAQVEQAVLAARRAFDHGPWPRMALSDRIAVLARMAQYLEEQREALVHTAVAETGSPRVLAGPAQIGLALDHARELPELLGTLPEWEHNELPLAQHLHAPGRLRLSIRRWEPVGVVAAITAYNFPLVTNAVKVFPALAAGNTVVLRPSPLTPLLALVLGDAAEHAGLPPGVLNTVVEAGNEGGVLLTSHPAVDMVSFTGSSAIGSRIAAQAAPTMKNLVLELGGKSVGLYLPDVLDSGPQPAVVGALTMFASHSGQACVAQTRMLVPEQFKADVLEALAAAVKALPVGDPQDDRTVIGPLIAAAAVDRVRTTVRAAVRAGARVVCGGGRPAGCVRGHFHEPTVLDVDDNANPAAQQEIFGPVLTVQGYRDLDQAVDIANDTRYGLSGGVYTADLQTGLSVAQRLRSGAVQVNAACATSWSPSGGVRASGLGRERGVAGLRAFQELKHISVGSV